MLCVKHWFKELDDPQAAAGPSHAYADTPIGQSLLKVGENVLKVCLILPTVLSKLENHFQIMN